MSRKRDARGRSQSEELNRPPCKYFFKGTCTKSPCEYWHLVNVNSFKRSRDVSSAQSAHFQHWKVEERPNKKPKKGMTKVQLLCLKSVRQLSCVSQETEPPESATIPRKGTFVLRPIRRVRFTSAALRQANIREKKGPSLGKIQVKMPQLRSPTLCNLRTDLQERLRDKSDAPAEMRGNLPGTSKSSKRKTKLLSFHLLRSGWYLPHPR